MSRGGWKQAELVERDELFCNLSGMAMVPEIDAMQYAAEDDGFSPLSSFTKSPMGEKTSSACRHNLGREKMATERKCTDSGKDTNHCRSITIRPTIYTMSRRYKKKKGIHELSRLDCTMTSRDTLHRRPIGVSPFSVLPPPTSLDSFFLSFFFFLFFGSLYLWLCVYVCARIAHVHVYVYMRQVYVGRCR